MDIDLYPINILFYCINFHNGVYKMNNLDHQDELKIKLKILRLHNTIQTLDSREAWSR